MSVITSVWAVFPREEEQFCLMPLHPEQLQKILTVWTDDGNLGLPSSLMGARVDPETGETVEQFAAFLFYETEEEITLAASWCFPQIVSILEELSEAERFIQSLEGGNYDLKDMLGL